MKNNISVSTPAISLDCRLSGRKTQVLSLLVQGLSNRRIADGLGLEYYTVSSHAKSIYTKLCVRKRSSAVFYATSSGLVEKYPSNPQIFGPPVRRYAAGGRERLVLSFPIAT